MQVMGPHAAAIFLAARAGQYPQSVDLKVDLLKNGVPFANGQRSRVSLRAGYTSVTVGIGQLQPIEWVEGEVVTMGVTVWRTCGSPAGTLTVEIADGGHDSTLMLHVGPDLVTYYTAADGSLQLTLQGAYHQVPADPLPTCAIPSAPQVSWSRPLP